MNHSFRVALVAGWLVWAATVAGCGSINAPPRDFSPVLARFFLESTDSGASTVVLPVSGVRVAIGDKPVFTEGDIVAVEIAQVELGRCLAFQLTPSAARDLYRLSGANQGRRLVLMVNDVALGARRLEAPLSEGVLFVFAEVTDAELAVIAVNLKKTSAELQRTIARKK